MTGVDNSVTHLQRRVYQHQSRRRHQIWFRVSGAHITGVMGLQVLEILANKRRACEDRRSTRHVRVPLGANRLREWAAIFFV